MQPAFAQETQHGSTESHSGSTATAVPAEHSPAAAHEAASPAAATHGTEAQNAQSTGTHGTDSHATAAPAGAAASPAEGNVAPGNLHSEEVGTQGSPAAERAAEEHTAATAATGGHDASSHGGGHGSHAEYHPPAPFVVEVVGTTVHLNTLITTWMVMAILITMAFMATRKLSKKPDTKQIFFESLVDLPHFIIKSQIAHHTTKYVPLIGTLFLFILVGDWLGLIPWRVLELFGTPPGFELASPTNDLNTNAALALTALASYWFFGISKKGLAHFKHYFQPMWFLFPLNMMEDVSRPLSLSFRLFGNILGGEIVIGILLFLTSAWIVTSVVVLPMFALEVLVGFIQAFIFSMLTASYIGGMVAEHH